MNGPEKERNCKGKSILMGQIIKVTRHLCFKNSKYLQLLDVQACNSAKKQQKGFLSDFE